MFFGGAGIRKLSPIPFSHEILWDGDSSRKICKDRVTCEELFLIYWAIERDIWESLESLVGLTIDAWGEELRVGVRNSREIERLRVREGENTAATWVDHEYWVLLSSMYAHIWSGRVRHGGKCERAYSPSSSPIKWQVKVSSPHEKSTGKMNTTNCYVLKLRN